MREQAEEIGRRGFQRDLQRRIVDRPDAERVGLERAFVDLFAILERIEEIGVLRAGRRIEQTAEREDEIARADRVAVRPFRRAQFERVDEAILADRPALGDSRGDFAFGIVGHEALEQIEQDVGFGNRRGLLWVERRRVAGLAAAIDHFGGGWGRGGEREGEQQNGGGEGFR